MSIFECKDLYLSAYLVTKGHQLEGIRRQGKSVAFCFTAGDDIDLLVTHYSQGRGLTDPVVFKNAVRDLRAIIAGSTPFPELPPQEDKS